MARSCSSRTTSRCSAARATPSPRRIVVVGARDAGRGSRENDERNIRRHDRRAGTVPRSDCESPPPSRRQPYRIGVAPRRGRRRAGRGRRGGRRAGRGSRPVPRARDVQVVLVREVARRTRGARGAVGVESPEDPPNPPSGASRLTAVVTRSVAGRPATSPRDSTTRDAPLPSVARGPLFRWISDGSPRTTCDARRRTPLLSFTGLSGTPAAFASSSPQPLPCVPRVATNHPSLLVVARGWRARRKVGGRVQARQGGGEGAARLHRQVGQTGGQGDAGEGPREEARGRWWSEMACGPEAWPPLPTRGSPSKTLEVQYCTGGQG